MFRDQPIKFVTTTATAIGKMKRRDALAKLSRLCLENAAALLASLEYCSQHAESLARTARMLNTVAPLGWPERARSEKFILLERP